MGNRDEGQSRLTAVTDCSSALYANTTVDGRDIVRQQLRQLRERWEKFIERITVAEQTVEKVSATWVAFSEQCDELEEWLDMIHSRLSTATVLQNTLQEKKDHLQLVKVVIIDLWHKPV